MDRIGIHILSVHRKSLFFLVMCDIVNSAMKHWLTKKEELLWISILHPHAVYGGARSGTGSVGACNLTSLDPCNSNVWVTMYPNQNKKARYIWNRLFSMHDRSADYYAKFQPKNQAERHSLSFFFLLEHFYASIDIILNLIYCLIKSQSAAVNA